jgi:hypothetical protein
VVNAPPRKGVFGGQVAMMDSAQPHDGSHALTDLVDLVLDEAEAGHVTVRRLVEAVGRASFTPVLILPALAVASPLSGVPFLSSLMGITIALVSAQMVLRRRYLWLPAFLMNRSVSGRAVRLAFKRVRPVVAWIDARSHRRWRAFGHRPLIYLPQLLCLVSGLAMPFLEFVPFSSSVLGVGVAILAIGMLTRDGAITLAGLLPYLLFIGLLARLI